MIESLRGPWQQKPEGEIVLRFGEEPFLECSSKGDKRFSAFYAKVNGESIESQYQRSKVFEGGITGLDVSTAKGRKPINGEACRNLYSRLWDIYFQETPVLLEVIKQYRGFSDIFGQEGHCCQAEEIYRIWRENQPEKVS